MTTSQIYDLIDRKAFPDTAFDPQLYETHTAWVILTDHYAFKIKKPVKLPFLDFSTCLKREQACRKEVELNNHFSKGIYLGVVPIREKKNQFSIQGDSGFISDWAVQMIKLNPSKRMDKMLYGHHVSLASVSQLAGILAEVHKAAEIVHPPHMPLTMRERFNEIRLIRPYMEGEVDRWQAVLDKSISMSDQFLKEHVDLIESRIEKGYFRKGHGDLHTRNVFIENTPIIFDCIEFSEEFREIDLLDELAFLCMDLEVRKHPDLSASFRKAYSAHLKITDSPRDEKLFQYYKLYRAGVRAKVLVMQALQSEEPIKRSALIMEAKPYLRYMEYYLTVLMGGSIEIRELQYAAY